MAKTFDCFLFFNEFHLLDLRLRTLDDVVDTFVIVEAPWTFFGKLKPLLFKEFHDGFKPWLHKIRHIELSGALPATIAWEREWASRNAMVEGLWDAEPDDWVFQSDCDEIWRPELKEAAPNDPVATYLQFHCYYHLNTPRSPHHAWRGTRRCKFTDYPGGQRLRDSIGREIENGGWHFSFLGSPEEASLKMRSFSHTEYSGDEWADPKRLAALMAEGRDPINPGAKYLPVPVDSTFPKPVLEDPGRWAKFLKPVPATPS